MTKQSINNVVYNTTLNNDITTSLLDKTLQDSYGIMYNRQAVYMYLMTLNGWTRTDLHKAIKARAAVTGVPYNRGILVKESLVTEYTMTHFSKLFRSVNMTVKNDFTKIIESIAKIMYDNKLSYSFLKDKLVKTKESPNPTESNPTESSVKNDSMESTKQKKTEVKDIDFDSVVAFIKSTSQANRLKLADFLAAAIESYCNVKKAA